MHILKEDVVTYSAAMSSCENSREWRQAVFMLLRMQAVALIIYSNNDIDDDNHNDNDNDNNDNRP